MTTNEERQLGRAKNAALAFFERRLSVPKIYIDAMWDGHHLDILAIDRDGVGDVHVVLLYACRYNNGDLDLVDYITATTSLLDRFSSIPAQYKYIAAVAADFDESISKITMQPKFGLRKLREVGMPEFSEKSFSSDGIGRVGFLTIEAGDGNELKANVEIKPERFRAKIAKLADEYVQHHQADWEIRA